MSATPVMEGRKKRYVGGGVMPQVAEHLPSKPEVLNSNSNAGKKKKR
jgi:hypothetical protein